MRKLFVVFLIWIASTTASAQNRYTIVFLNKNPDAEKLTPEQSKKIMDEHLANQDKMAREGKLLASGPFAGGGGIFIMSSTNADEVNQWISADPGIQAKRWNIELLPYQPRYGGICPVDEKYEMTNYSFVRFTAEVSKFTASTYPQIIKKHDDYLKEIVKTGNVITEGIFGDNEGGILVMKGDVQREVFEADPGVQEGLLTLEIKKLFIAKGSFCEKN